MLMTSMIPNMGLCAVGILFTEKPTDPNGVFHGERFLDTVSTLPNLCRSWKGADGCDLRFFSMSDHWINGNGDGYETDDNNNAWMECMMGDYPTLGDVGKCLRQKNVPLRISASDQMTGVYDDHTQGCMAYSHAKAHTYNPYLGNVMCIPVGGVANACKFDAPILAGSFTDLAGVLTDKKVVLGSVNITCNKNISIILSVPPGPIDMVSDDGSSQGLATIDLGAGAGNPKRVGVLANKPTKIDVNAYVSGKYDAGRVQGAGTIIADTP
ncbi:MAG: hypothetical protein ACRC8R_08470 [Aeromonas hydrophila]